MSMSNATKSTETGSRLWVAVALSMTAIFTSYAISVFNYEKEHQVNANSNSHRPVVVSYLA
jgi:hypothetical protein